MSKKTKPEILEVKKTTPSDKEKLIWLFKTIVKDGKHINSLGDVLMVELDKLQIAPYFNECIEQDLTELLISVQEDKDFYRKHNMTNYKPDIDFDYSHVYSDNYVVMFSDFTHDFLIKYLEYRLGVKGNIGINSNSIEKIEILEDKKEQGRIKIYINGKYDDGPLDFARKGNWQLMYKIASKEYVDYDKKGKAFYDYFNCNKNNPLYATYGFEITQILKEEDGCIVPNVEIKLTTQNKIARLKSA